MSKKYCYFISILFCAFIGALFVLHILLPDSARSENENRLLAQFPKFSISDVKSGKYMKGIETYLSDQFPVRDNWIAMKAATEKLSGKKENNGVYICGDTLISKVEQPKEELVEMNLTAVDKLTANLDIPVYFNLIPTAAEIWKDKLPENAINFDQSAFNTYVAAHTTAEYVDVFSAMQSHAAEDIYYRTDHHWTSLGAYYGYLALTQALGVPAVNLADYTSETLTDSFYGTLYSNSGVRWVKPDSIEAYIPDDTVTVVSYEDGAAVAGELYAREHLTEKNKYPVFLGGNQPLCILENDNALSDKKILVLRDSYADSEAPFLSQSFAQVHLLDLRYYKASVQQYVADNHIDAVVVSYSTANFITDNNIFLAPR